MPSADHSRQQARRCRELANATMDRGAAKTLRQMAEQYEEEARLAEESERPEEPPQPLPG
jgi:hypothetical protein